MERIFKNLILASTLLTVIFWVLPLYNYANFSEEEFNVLSWAGFGASIPSNDLIYWSILVIWLITNLGLYFFVKPFKAIFTILLIITGILNLFWGISVLPPIEVTISTLLTLLDGSIITMLYLTSISNKFTNTLTSSSSGTDNP